MSRQQIETSEHEYNNFFKVGSSDINELAKALASAQSKMEGAAKDSDNPFFKSKYADLSSVTGAVRTGLDGTGLSYVQIVHDRESAAAIETVILHSSGQSLSTGIVCVPVVKQDAQGYGSAITYARRYGLAMAFGVAPEDDDGNAAAMAKPTSKQPTVSAESRAHQWIELVAKSVSVEQLAECRELAMKALAKNDDKEAWTLVNAAARDRKAALQAAVAGPDVVDSDNLQY